MAEGGLQVHLRQAGPIPLNVDFSCGEGELLALIGPSGSGKSTVLRAVAGLYRPAEGRVSCTGADLARHQGRPRPASAISAGSGSCSRAMRCSRT